MTDIKLIRTARFSLLKGKQFITGSRAKATVLHLKMTCVQVETPGRSKKCWPLLASRYLFFLNMRNMFLYGGCIYYAVGNCNNKGGGLFLVVEALQDWPQFPNQHPNHKTEGSSVILKTIAIFLYPIETSRSNLPPPSQGGGGQSNFWNCSGGGRTIHFAQVEFLLI